MEGSEEILEVSGAVESEQNNSALNSETVADISLTDKEESIYTQENESKNVTDSPESCCYSFETVQEVARFSNPSMKQKYFIGCKWSPDGTCLLSNCADYKLRIIDFPQEFLDKKVWNKNDETVLNLKTSLEVTEGGLVYDYAWYPFMSSWNPPTCCFITSSSSSPVHLWDAYTGKIRASYRAYDYADEIHSALSLCFSTTGEDIYCGFKNAINIFDISKPGRECEKYNLKEISGQKGIVSCICENPSVPQLFAAGTYSKTIGLYTRSHEFICLLTGQKSGLTHLRFSDDGLKLFSGARMDNEIICWDIRSPGNVLLSMKRTVETNQRIYFDVTKDNKYLISGGTDGYLHVWDLFQDVFESECDLNSMLSWKAQNDCVNGISVHGTYPLIATSSGQQHRLELISDENDDDLFCDKIKEKAENCIKFWWVGPFSNNHENEQMDQDENTV